MGSGRPYTGHWDNHHEACDSTVYISTLDLHFQNSQTSLYKNLPYYAVKFKALEPGLKALIILILIKSLRGFYAAHAPLDRMTTTCL